jgi:hypothetical protein
VTSQVNDPNPARAGARGAPTWALVLVTLGVWVAFLRVEITMLPAAFRAAQERGEVIAGLRRELFEVSFWWCNYWWLFPIPMLLLLAGAAAARAFSANEVVRRRLARVWLLVFVLPTALLALASLAVCYRA